MSIFKKKQEPVATPVVKTAKPVVESPAPKKVEVDITKPVVQKAPKKSFEERTKALHPWEV